MGVLYGAIVKFSATALDRTLVGCLASVTSLMCIELLLVSAYVTTSFALELLGVVAIALLPAHHFTLGYLLLIHHGKLIWFQFATVIHAGVISKTAPCHSQAVSVYMVISAQMGILLGALFKTTAARGERASKRHFSCVDSDMLFKTMRMLAQLETNVALPSLNDCVNLRFHRKNN